ncbi:MAG: hypothetical protein GY943_05570 [Chloroflexi bacterium]|nr:hypothetical protein [Chloroflexota bacterium]
MRRFILLALFLLLSLSVPTIVLAIVQAQESEHYSEHYLEEAPSTTLTPPPSQMLADGLGSTLTTEAPHEIVPLSVAAAADTCFGAVQMSIPGGDSTVVNDFTVDASDPNLSCEWGTPNNAQGYRTAWYKFTSPTNGIATIDTSNSSYDTIVTVYTDMNPDDAVNLCSDTTEMLRVSCNDDAHGFTSHNEFLVTRNQEYYIQVADWQFGGSGNKELRLSLLMDPVYTEWEQSGLMSLPRSRHAVAIKGNNIYVIGGQTQDFDPFGNSDPIITNRIDRFNTVTGNWTELGVMPSTPDGAGYSNTTATYVSKQNNGDCTKGCIYLPGGYNNGPTYDGTHWVYDIETGGWIEKASVETAVWPNGVPFAWSTAVTKPDNTGYYLIGGLSSLPAITTTDIIHNSVYEYTVSTDSWAAINALNTARYGHTAAIVDNQLCVAGGITSNLTLLDTAECWNMGGGGWVPNAATLNISRYGADSAVGPNGKWYVFGGSDGNHNAVSVTEVYDPANPDAGWVELNVNYDLGASGGIAARAWPRGRFIGNTLWAIGGNATEGILPPISLIEKLFIPTNTFKATDTAYLPLILFQLEKGPSDDHFGIATVLKLNKAEYSDFDTIADLFDTYTFHLNSTTAISVKLTQIPAGSNYNVSVYDRNKQLWGVGDNPSNLNETLNVTLSAGQYYLMVERVYPAGLPNTANYRLIVEN